MHITVLPGCIENMNFARALANFAQSFPDVHITSIANIVDSFTLHGLRLCPDLDAATTALDGTESSDVHPSYRVHDQISQHGFATTWFPITDDAFARHILRSQLLALGYPLSHVCAALAKATPTPHQVLPLTDDTVELHVVCDNPNDPGNDHAIGQHAWQAINPLPAARRFIAVGHDRATALPEAITAIANSDLVVIPPANPMLVTSSMLQLSGITAALRGRTGPTVAASPLLSGFDGAELTQECLRVAELPATEDTCRALFDDSISHWVTDNPSIASGAAGGPKTITCQPTADQPWAACLVDVVRELLPQRARGAARDAAPSPASRPGSAASQPGGTAAAEAPGQ